MKTLPALRSSFLFLYTLSSAIVPAPVVAHAEGRVDYTLEWHSNHQTYTYVFSGVVSSHGKPCPKAKIKLQLSRPGTPDLIQDTVASAEGLYELTVAVPGSPQDSADWKLVAQAPETATEIAEIEGRTILTENQSTVMVERPLQLIQG